MNRTFKIVGRYKFENQPYWAKGKAGTQFKKRTYTSKQDFDRYGPELIIRWERFCDVSSFELIDGKWIKL